MEEKSTHSSVTNEPCKCNYLRDAAEDASNPIGFDEKTGEYQFIYSDQMLVIYHCPFCGGAAPKSKRHLLFTTISAEERERLCDITASLKTVQQVKDALGPPDWESHGRSFRSEKDGAPPKVEIYPMLSYKNLSDVAEV
jgi:hypothetical protein